MGWGTNFTERFSGVRGSYFTKLGSTTIKILGVTITNSLSFSEHIHSVIRSCSQTLHVLRIRARGMITAIYYMKSTELLF